MSAVLTERSACEIQAHFVQITAPYAISEIVSQHVKGAASGSAA